MITYTHIMVRFGELSTKGKNKKNFIHQLYQNIVNSLSDFSNIKFIERYDHIYVELNGEDYEPIISRLQDISGIHSLSLVVKIDKDINSIINTSLEIIKDLEGKTFKVKCKRSDKTYPIISDDIIRKVASQILKTTSLRVDVHNPDILVNIEVRDEGAYVFLKTYKGAGGYPLGTGGKVLMMLSGGIDSPVAMYMLLRRGIAIECIHFASPPYTQQGVIDKLEDLLNVLTRYQAKIRLNIIPFTKIQEKIYEVSNESYAITIMRRMMYRIADKVVTKRNLNGIANGESIGQVASQTLESIQTIGEVINKTIIRPLAVVDKLDIIKTAEKIGTYEISIRPYEDCCTIFAPKNPKTKPRVEDVVKFEEKYDFDSLIDEAVKNIEVKYIDRNNKEEI